jgi:hypothetical protein
MELMSTHMGTVMADLIDAGQDRNPWEFRQAAVPPCRGRVLPLMDVLRQG